MPVGLDTRGVASEEGGASGAGASGAETGCTGSAQNKLAPKTQKSENEAEITTVPDILDLKHTCSHGDAGCAPDALGRRLKFPLSLEQHLDLEMSSNISTLTLHRGVSRNVNTSFTCAGPTGPQSKNPGPFTSINHAHLSTPIGSFHAQQKQQGSAWIYRTWWFLLIAMRFQCLSLTRINNSHCFLHFLCNCALCMFLCLVCFPYFMLTH